MDGSSTILYLNTSLFRERQIIESFYKAEFSEFVANAHQLDDGSIGCEAPGIVHAMATARGEYSINHVSDRFLIGPMRSI